LTWKGFAPIITLLPADAEGGGVTSRDTLLVVLFIVVCLFLIMVVLLQQGRERTLRRRSRLLLTASFGPRGTATLMHKLTTGSFVLFVALCIGLSVVTAEGAGR